jgi:hypothetical protein
MHRSFWELEDYAKDFQERRWAEAARQRRADEAMGVVAAGINPFNLGIAQVMSKTRAWRSSSRTPRATQLDEPEWLVSHVRPEIIQTDCQRSPRARPRRLLQPYADMVVIAWGTVAEVAEQPRGVGHC